MKHDRPNDPTTPSVFDGYISEAEYARQRGVSVRTCQRDRMQGKAPPHVVVGRDVLYRVKAVQDWLIKHERPTVRSHGRKQAWRGA